jgi:SAM-dependent methyltransferase
MRLAPHAHVLEAAGGPVLWSARTGRSLPVSRAALEALADWPEGLAPSPTLAPFVTRLAAHGLLGADDSPVDALYACRSRLPLLFPATPCLWVPVPTEHPAGGHPWRALPIEAHEVALWRAFNGARTVAAAAAHAGVDVAAARRFLTRLTGPDVQAVQLRTAPLARRDPSLERLVAPARDAHPARADGMYGSHGETRLEPWHASHVVHGPTHFDNVETTVAHAFALPHPALDGEPFGARLHDVLAARGAVPADGLIVEIGPGDGELGEAFLARAARPLDYLRVDASPELLRTQRQRMPGTREALGSATALPVPDRGVQLVLCNEVIADLTAVPWDGGADAEGPAREVAERVRSYGLPLLPGRAWYNLGAWKLVEELARVLAPGGTAYVSEFGTLDESPEEATQLDHPEVSIHFGHLQAVAEALGLRARVEPMAELLKFDMSAQQLSRHSYEALRARCAAEGRHLPARAGSPATLRLPWPVEGLHWVPLSERGPGPLLTRFHALFIER